MANAVETLRLLSDDATIREQAPNILCRQVLQMSRLVDDLLDVSRITRGKITLRQEQVELSSAVAQAVSTTKPLFESRRHKLLIVLPQGKIYLQADPTRLEQILANLLHNAAKYSEPGGTIRLSAEFAEDEIAIRIRDSGVGIPAHLLPNVFDLFIQGDQSLDRSRGGLGIGLTLVRRLVELHGGKVSARSDGPDQGSEFEVRLPAKLVTDDDYFPAIDNPRGVPQTEHARRILVVDDNVDLAATTSMLLRAAGHLVNSVGDGLLAVETARQWDPDVMLVDIGLPGIDGYEVARQLRRLPALDRTLLVAVTGYGQQEDRALSAEAGFDIHLVKPVGFQELQETVVLSRASRQIARKLEPGQV
jgi:two-component system CheB/CheR fusion protein